MIDVGNLIHDPDFCTKFDIVRIAGTEWVKGEQVITLETITVEGIASPATSKDLELLPEGDRRQGVKSFYADIPFHITDKESTSDYFEFRSSKYKLLQVFDYSDNGYYKALAAYVGDANDL